MTCKDCSRFKSGRCAISDEDNDVCSNFSGKAPTRENYETLYDALTKEMGEQAKIIRMQAQRLDAIKKYIAELRSRNISFTFTDYDKGYYRGFDHAIATIEGMISRLEAEQAKGENK